MSGEGRQNGIADLKDIGGEYFFQALIQALAEIGINIGKAMQ